VKFLGSIFFRIKLLVLTFFLFSAHILDSFPFFSFYYGNLTFFISDLTSSFPSDTLLFPKVHKWNVSTLTAK